MKNEFCKIFEIDGRQVLANLDTGEEGETVLKISSWCSEIKSLSSVSTELGKKSKLLIDFSFLDIGTVEYLYSKLSPYLEAKDE